MLRGGRYLEVSSVVQSLGADPFDCYHDPWVYYNKISTTDLPIINVTKKQLSLHVSHLLLLKTDPTLLFRSTMFQRLSAKSIHNTTFQHSLRFPHDIMTLSWVWCYISLRELNLFLPPFLCCVLQALHAEVHLPFLLVSCGGLLLGW